MGWRVASPRPDPTRSARSNTICDNPTHFGFGVLSGLGELAVSGRGSKAAGCARSVAEAADQLA